MRSELASQAKLRSVRSTVWTLLATVGLGVGFGALIGASQMSSWDNLDAAERMRFDPTSCVPESLAKSLVIERSSAVLAGRGYATRDCLH